MQQIVFVAFLVFIYVCGCQRIPSRLSVRSGVCGNPEYSAFSVVVVVQSCLVAADSLDIVVETLVEGVAR